MTGKRNTKKRSNQSTKRSASTAQNAPKQDMELWYEVGLIVLFAFMVFLFLCNFNLVGPIGVFFKHIMFGLFGLMAYTMPVLLFVAVFFGWVNKKHPAVRRKLIAGIILFLILGAAFELLEGRIKAFDKYDIGALYSASVEHLNGGGVLGGSIAYGLYKLFDVWGSVLIILVMMIICLVFITEKSFVKGIRRTGRAVANKARTDAGAMREYAAERARIREEEQYEQLRLREEQLAGKEGQRGQLPQTIPDRNRKVKGINFNSIFTRLSGKEETVMEGASLDVSSDASSTSALQDSVVDINTGVGGTTSAFRASSGAAYQDEAKNITDTLPSNPLVKNAVSTGAFTYAATGTLKEVIPETDELHELRPKAGYHNSERLYQNTQDILQPVNYQKEENIQVPEEHQAVELTYSNEKAQLKLVEASQNTETTKTYNKSDEQEITYSGASASGKIHTKPAAKPPEKTEISSTKSVVPANKPYLFPPVSLLQKGKSSNPRDGQRHLEDTARRLQECLKTFGVNVTITDISQGPAVTRYELQPEQGVKVSKIVNLSDDIKLNLAATDIRIEAPIPGKSAIGIEVPNKENSAVAFRELIETQEFKDFPSKIAFAVGKDIAGKVVVSDIAKMPHMLIAGSTGSGKSVCINTLIMSILYKAHPDEVKLIMIDPKVVELSSYNGIPHLLIPVVTDPKQAAGALQWGVSEMMARYEKFAELNVRDMKGYNAKIDERAAKGEENLPKKLPQIVIIVDELADLMMVAPGEVEESICRLAQLARAAGIHLIIATQRPSVDVITGLIKANMPSRVAFAVSSGVDSRTILDMNGAEKLLGKGDMLFYPQGYSKPVRVQGSYVSDAEVGAVVDYLKNQQIGNIYQEEIQNQINNLKSGGGNDSAGAGARADDRDPLFADAGRFIIEKDKASIGMLQRVFKIGFNRAARIVDQLCEHGVVGEEEGTKPRKVLMSPEQFENLLEEI